MNLTTHSLILALGLALAAPAHAADPKTATEQKPAAATAAVRPAAEELARVLMPKSTWDAGMKALASNVEARLQAHPGQKLQVPADFPAKVRSELDAALPYDALLGMHARQLGAAYSDAELKDLLAFYRTPTGKKSLEVMPAVTEKVAVETQQRVESKMPQIMERLSSMVKPPAGSKGMPPGHPSASPTSAPAKATEAKQGK